MKDRIGGLFDLPGKARNRWLEVHKRQIGDPLV